MRSRFYILSIATVLLIGVILSLTFVLTIHRKGQAFSHPQPSPEQLEAFRALPYTQWKDGANPKVLGVTRYDPRKSFDGFNLYTNDEREIYLMDMRGRRVHKWFVPGKKNCEYAEVMDNGDLIAVCVTEALVKLDWNSNVIWEFRSPVHHDFAVLPDKSLLVLSREPAVKYNSYNVEFDTILHLSENGKLISRWFTLDHIAELKKYHRLSPLDYPRDSKTRPPIFFYDYYHLNTIEVLPETELGTMDKRFQAGNILICSRHLDWIAILDQRTKHVVWSWGPGVLNGPHMPTMLKSGHILVFDNGTKRKWSRVLEIEPSSGQIIWQYKGEPPESFFSAWRGANQELPNGNVLITDSENGRALEITRDRKIVWDFWNPELRGGKRKRIYRLMRLPEQTVISLLHSKNLPVRSQ